MPRAATMMMLPLLPLLLTTPAWGHHPGASGASPIEPRTQAATEMSAGGFDLPGVDGTWQAVTMTGELAWRRRGSLFARIPAARIAYGDGDTAFGLADVELGLKASLLRGGDGDVVAGVSLELPTGSNADGLGSGHPCLASFVMASRGWQVGDDSRFVLIGGLTDRLAFRGGHAHEAARVPRHGAIEGDAIHGSPLAPHADHEVAAALGAAFVHGRQSFSLGSELVYVFADDSGLGPWSGRAEWGLSLGASARVTAGVDLPLAGDPRFAWRGRVALAWLL
jgi:hypothetical protein